MSALRAAFDEERAWLRDCDDQRAVLDRMAGYRDNLAAARRNRNAEAHALVEHLIELAEDRLTALKVGATRAKQRPAAPPPRVEAPPPPPEPPARPRAAPARTDDSEVVRQLQAALAASQEAERRAARERDAAERRARDANAERDSAVASQRREQSRTIAAPSVPAAKPPVRDGRWLSTPATLPSAPTSARPTSAPRPPTATAPAPRNPPATTASPRPAKPEGAGGRAPATEAPTLRAASPLVPPTSTTAPKSSPPPAVPADPGGPALTGADLAAFRRGLGLTQVAAAQRLGVTQGTISKAEGNPRTVLGPGLQDALRRAAG